MKVIGEKCGWVIPRRERHVLKLLRYHTREREHDFVSKASSDARGKPAKMISVEFAREELSAFEPAVRIVPQSESFAR